ncbi:hypothetical protein E0H75_05405 [Kribbella capetownensis]|uniref:Lipoprotein n=1 Tax=Kribbella capetownensis TaxID=1572659 RepID=A0A4R0K5E5_9ACTN|nr:hypothetical protein [Kribbella capetownensis]TCC53156.1 hypothetical protein E0H75_05405 [Kribbella capetownensis]
MTGVKRLPAMLACLLVLLTGCISGNPGTEEGATGDKFVTSARHQLAFCKLVAVFPGSVQTVKEPFFTNISGNTANDQGRRLLVQTFNQAADAISGSPNDEALRALFDEQVRAYMLGTKTASAALATAEKQWNAELAKAR